MTVKVECRDFLRILPSVKLGIHRRFQTQLMKEAIVKGSINL